MASPQEKDLDWLPKKKTDTSLDWLPEKKKETPVAPVVKPPWYDNYLGLIRPMLAGAQSGMAGTMKGLISAADFISDKLGIPKSDAARMIARDLDTYAAANKKRGVGGIAGDVAEGIGGAALAIPEISILGPYGMAVKGGLQGLTEGGVPGAITGAIGGGLSQGVLGGTSGLNLPGRIASGAAFGAATTPGGVRERVGGAATMGVLGAVGGEKQRRVVDLRDAPVSKIKTEAQVKPEAAKVAAEGHPVAARDVFMAAFKDMPKLRGLQEAINAEERAVRIPAAIEAGQSVSGEAGWKAQKAAMSGEFRKVQYEGIRDRLGETPEKRQAVVDELFMDVQNSPSISEVQRFTVKSGLEDLLKTGKIPQEKQLELMNKVWGDEFVRTLMKNRDAFTKMKELGVDIANIPRALMASMDLSFGLRQGLMIAAGHPTIFWKDWVRQFNKGGKNAYRAANDAIVKRPTYELMDRYGLSLTEVGGLAKNREEQYQSTLAERIPVIGKGVKWSDRVFSQFGNQLRADTFDYYVKRANDMGRDLWSKTFSEWLHKKGISLAQLDDSAKVKAQKDWVADVKLGHDIAKIVNNGTGRGTFGPKLENLAPAMNALMFSPRLFASRFNTLTNPAYYMRLDPFARKAQLKMTISMVGAGMTTLALLKQAGVNVGTNPSSADFGKIKIGDTRVDIWGGYQQYAVLAARMLRGETTSSLTGKTSSLTSGKYGTQSRLDVLSNFFKGKLSPVPAFAVGLLSNRAASGDKFDLSTGTGPGTGPLDWRKNPVASMFIPMIIQDTIDLAQEDPSLIPLSVLGSLGVGLQTYNSKKR